MELTTYDDIWSCFRDISGLALDTIPNTDDDIRREIRNGIRSYNIKTDDSESKLTFDDMIETINQRLDDNRLKLLALIIKENLLTTQLELFEQIYQYDIKEVKSKFYKDQVTSRESNIAKVNKEILELLGYMDSKDLNE